MEDFRKCHMNESVVVVACRREGAGGGVPRGRLRRHDLVVGVGEGRWEGSSSVSRTQFMSITVWTPRLARIFLEQQICTGVLSNTNLQHKQRNKHTNTKNKKKISPLNGAQSRTKKKKHRRNGSSKCELVFYSAVQMLSFLGRFHWGWQKNKQPHWRFFSPEMFCCSCRLNLGKF